METQKATQQPIKGIKMTNPSRTTPNRKLKIGTVDARTVDENGTPTQAYKTWRQMMYRCYDEGQRALRKTYADCTVCPEWHTFSTFQAWFDANYVEGQQLDKDILFPGNRVYSPSKCCFVPAYINSCMGFKRVNNGNYVGVKPMPNYPEKFLAQCNVDGKNKHLGVFKTQKEAFMAYRDAKRKELAKKAARAFLAGEITLPVFYALITMPIEKPARNVRHCA